MAASDRLRDYYWLTKPGIVWSNVMAASAGFLLMSRWRTGWWTLFATLIGTSLIIASACVINNYLDRGIDAKMERTKKRALPSGRIPVSAALTYAAVLGIVGFLVLGLWTNGRVVLIGAVGYFSYIVLYGIGKRRTVHGTLIGTISGATPPVAGYAAATGRLDGGALLLFLILVAWQMPHFYAIAMRRHDDYDAAGLPVLPVVKGMRRTKMEIIAYTGLFAIFVSLLSLFGYAGAAFVIVMGPLGLYWLWRGIEGFDREDDKKWGGQMFGLSLLILLALCGMLALGNVLP
jgi:protoheme IX farnesyltransferase